MTCPLDRRQIDVDKVCIIVDVSQKKNKMNWQLSQMENTSQKKSKKVYWGSFFPVELYITTIFTWALGKERNFGLKF